MSQINYTLWKEDSDFLRDFKYPKRYFTPEQYDKSMNPLESLVVIPDLDDFFGTKICNIFIVGIPYGWKPKTSGAGWEEDWTPEGYDDAKQRHIDNYHMFGKYETHVFMDFNIVQKVMDVNSDSKLREIMNVTKEHMREMCDDLADYGFTLEPDITADVGPEHFFTILDAFYTP